MWFAGAIKMSHHEQGCSVMDVIPNLTSLHLIELHHVKAAGPTPMMTGPSLGAGTQSNSGLAAVGSVGNRGLLLGPHMTSIESFRGAPGMRVSGCGIET